MKKTKKLLTIFLLLGTIGSAFTVVAAPSEQGHKNKHHSSTVMPSEEQTSSKGKFEKRKIQKKNTNNADEDERISINTATAEELARSLNGIGKKKAEAIVKYRETYVEFTEIDELKEVSGIGPAFMRKNSSKLKL